MKGVWPDGVEILLPGHLEKPSTPEAWNVYSRAR